ncbi:cyanamide hydratase [Tothia fuscella]|uniref:Cyanamide hydratase n=1 Tax=Tothia fuscella TaxID=1048955 RepID=A0A9P4NJD0_9PEZI|nr:cyanamide hydratase [Tothia fuscella]
MSTTNINPYGWSAVPVSLNQLIKNTSSSNSTPISAASISFPNTTLSIKTFDYVQPRLNPKTLAHSQRVYLYGHTILTQHFPEFVSTGFLETYYLTCLLHDIGTAAENLSTTKMSFDFYGAIVALKILKEFGAEEEQAQAVCEAIIRHQDLGETGSITSLGGIIQLATVFGEPPAFHQFVIAQLTVCQTT